MSDPTPEMVERVACAIAIGLTGAKNPRMVQDVGPPSSRGKPFWKHYEAAARAAIEAMREPTAAMLSVVKYDEYDWKADNWRAMIDAALHHGPV